MRTLSVVVATITAALPAVAHARGHQHDSESCARVEVEEKLVQRSSTRAGRTPDSSSERVVVYLNGGGGRVTAGFDDSSSNSSAVLYSHGIESMSVPRYRGSRRSWRRIVECVNDGFAPFSVEIVTKRPDDGDYIMAMVGGRPSLIGYPDHVSGIAPFTGDVIPSAIVYVFERTLRGHAQSVCHSILHEVGHALGLEHAYLCEDPMSYLGGCGNKSFQDEDAWCGEFEARECAAGGTQNSYTRLASAVGLRGDQRLGDDRAEDARVARTDRLRRRKSSRRPRVRDERPPEVEILSPSRERLPGDDSIEIVVWAEDDQGLREIELAWVTPDDAYTLRCSSMPDDLPAVCIQERDRFVFRLSVGHGERAFAVRAVDRAGNEAVTEPRIVVFENKRKRKKRRRHARRRRKR